jgi:predicted outer membrane repeat protein
MHRLTALVSSLALLAGLFMYAPQSVRASTTDYIGPGGGSGNCASPTYITDGAADHVEFNTAVGDLDGNINNILYVCPGTYDIDNTVYMNGDLTIEGVSGAASTILDADEYDVGGILYLNGSLRVSGLTFQNADSNNPGGAIEAQGDLTVRDSVFVNNHSDQDGGAIYANGFTPVITGSTFTDNSANGSGGAVRVYNLDLVADSTFTNNIADADDGFDGKGGAIYVAYDVTDLNSDGEAGLHSNNFISNVAQGGGAVSIGNDLSSSATITGNSFSTNEATGGDGGAVEIGDDVSGGVITGNSFEQNVAADEGGGMYVEDDFQTGSELTDNTFSSNTAKTHGGGFMVDEDMRSGTLISGNTFSANRADSDSSGNGDGGGLNIDEDFEGSVTKNKFLNNSAVDGGGLYAPDLIGSAVITMNTFRKNVATEHGGGAYMDDQDGDQTDLAVFTKNSFRGNRATESGGGLYLSFDDTSPTPGFFTRNIYRSNRAQLGGAIAFYDGCDSLLTSSRAVARLFKKDRFASNKATGSRRTANGGLVPCEVAP